MLPLSHILCISDKVGQVEMGIVQTLHSACSYKAPLQESQNIAEAGHLSTSLSSSGCGYSRPDTHARTHRVLIVRTVKQKLKKKVKPGQNVLPGTFSHGGSSSHSHVNSVHCRSGLYCPIRCSLAPPWPECSVFFFFGQLENSSLCCLYGCCVICPSKFWIPLQVELGLLEVGWFLPS